jgi:polysaccharide deacetylase 2 family uncharacterized protein YibQ
MMRPKRKKQKQGGRAYAALFVVVVVLLAVGGYLLFGSRPEKPKSTSVPATPVQKPPAVLPSSPVAPPPPQVAPKPEEKPAIPVQKSVPQTAPAPVITGSGTGKLAIIIDDMGTTVQEARSLAAIGVPLTLSIIPGLRSYREVAAFAASSGVETMIHIPMQSKGWPGQRLEANGLLVSMAENDIREHIENFQRNIPQAVGANNHMGSEFTEHGDKMQTVLGVLQRKGLFFIDSVTSPKTVGYKLAQEMGIKSARRNVFLDNEQSADYILGQLNQAVRMAKKNGAAIAICHPHPITIKTLSAALPALKHQGITLVPASELVK